MAWATRPSTPSVWDRYLISMFVLNSFGIFCAIITAIVAQLAISPVGSGAVNRTRPLTHRLLYWGRVGPALVTLLAGYATGIAISFALLLALHGPVWQHLNVNGQGLAITLKQMHRWAWMLNTSLPRLLVSAATSMCMVFSGFIFLQQLRLGRLPMGPLKTVALILGPMLPGYLFVSELSHLLLPRISRMFFFYSLSDSAPPPWTAALVPISITVAFLIGRQCLGSCRKIAKQVEI